MLEAVITDAGKSSTSELARRIGMPVATAHRQVATLVAQGYLRAIAYGRHLVGPRLLNLVAQLDHKQLIANVAGPVLHRLAGELRCIAQLGTLENEMVTYRIKTGQAADHLFTRVGMQLEAYCSGIGKVLLAHLPEHELKAYLSNGPFVALTPQTIVDPARLKGALARIKKQGYATDDGEIEAGLRCVAVPLRSPAGSVTAAISVSQAAGPALVELNEVLPLLLAAQAEIEAAAFG